MRKKSKHPINLLICFSLFFLAFSGCKKDEATIPVLTTSAVSEIAQTSFTCQGNINSDGGEPITDCGVCWGTNLNPSINDNKISGELISGTFTCNITGLIPNTHYYARAYATNSVGTGYGNGVPVITKEIQVPVLTTSAISLLTQTTATSGGTVNSDGGAPVTICGVCWSTNHNPTITDNKTTDDLKATFTSNLTGLNPNTTYYVRAYSTNNNGTGYGNEIEFTTKALVAQVPVLTTSEIINITQTSATCGGNISFDGNATVTDYGIVWDTGLSPSLTYTKVSDNLNNGTFTVNLDGLTPNATYYVRTYATNSAGTGYGEEVTFKTLEEVVVNKEYRISVDFECGEALSPSDRPNVYVIWMENESSSFIQNMFICRKLIFGGLTGTALPYWKVNKYPKSVKSEVDAVTSATVPNQNFTVSAILKDNTVKNFKMYFEIDHSFDENDWFSDQPALLYSADINLNDTIFELSTVGWTPNENTENQVPNTSNGKLESEMRYITNLKSGSTFGPVDSRSSTKMVKRIKVRIE